MADKALAVLVVDDSTVVVDFVSSILLQLGCEIYVASDGKQAVSLASEVTFDIILMDIYMPVMDGYEATAAIRKAEEETGACRSIIVAMTSSIDKEKFSAAGFDEYLPKPVNRQSLQDLIHHWFGKRIAFRQPAWKIKS